MNTGNIKSYAPKARNAFITAMTKQAAKYGITVNGIEPMEQRGDLVLIGDSAFPKTVARPRNALTKLVEQQGFIQTMEQAAYSWFNRLCAIRFMELKGYLEHGRRVLSHPADPQGFQILEDCLEIDISGMDQQRIQELKLDGTQDETLYRELLLAQCHALHETMPFLFEALDDATELLLPENLTKTDSLIRELVSAIPEEDWEQVEIIGWLYQFYISEKKDQVIGKVVKSEDIPAATQLFTPNWIVQYLVQNSVGRQWMQTYPDSPLKDKMPYYIEPAEQTEGVQAQLKAITPDTIDPESIKVLDPACGSGHILVEAYKVLKAIYEERGYRGRDIPKLILENNLFGLDIDDRAGQLAGFALMMLAREDDRRIFSRNLKLNVLSLQETNHLDLKSIWQALNMSGDWQRGSSQNLFESEQADLSSAKADNRYQLLQRTLECFSQAKTFGSLIEVPAEEEAPLKELLDELELLFKDGDSMQKPTAEQLIPYVKQAWLLSLRYDAVIANPPYMGSKYQAPLVKKYLKENFNGYEKDLFSGFIIRNLQLANDHGQLGFMTPFVWMFISSYEQLRKRLIEGEVISTLIQLEYSGFDGATVPICTFTLNKGHIAGYNSCYIRLSDFRGAVNQGPKTLEAIENRGCGWFYEARPDDFSLIPGAPLSYWVDDKLRYLFKKSDRLNSCGEARVGLQTNDNDRFLRLWHEVPFTSMLVEYIDNNETGEHHKKWFPYQKGGSFRKWYGNHNFVVNWENDGEEVIKLATDIYGSPTRTVRSRSHYFKEGLTWSTISSGAFSARYNPPGFIFDIKGSVYFPHDISQTKTILGMLNSKVVGELMAVMSPTLDFTTGIIEKIPVANKQELNVGAIVDELISISKSDWDITEASWGFNEHVLIKQHDGFLSAAFERFKNESESTVLRYKELEEELNCEIIDFWGLGDILTKDVSTEKVSLIVNPNFRYDADLGYDSLLNRFQSDTLSELISYSIGCMVGRYSLDRKGLVYAHSGNQGFTDLVSEGAYQTFSADDDGIVPLNDQEWFPDDATNRFREFVKTVWGEGHLQENLDFVAESLCQNAIKPKRGESALDTIRRYLSTQFYKDHLKTYKKRPIYWLFSSGKQKAFECLVYLHRYNEGTLARMRTEYVIPLTAKLNTYVDKLEQDKEASSSAAEIKRLEKEITKLHKQQAELATFDEKLRHYADQRISLDLDDGVKVNYGKFGDLLAEVKAITGKKPE